jgi:hypothetical protein
VASSVSSASAVATLPELVRALDGVTAAPRFANGLSRDEWVAQAKAAARRFYEWVPDADAHVIVAPLWTTTVCLTNFSAAWTGGGGGPVVALANALDPSQPTLTFGTGLRDIGARAEVQELLAHADFCVQPAQCAHVRTCEWMAGGAPPFEGSLCTLLRTFHRLIASYAEPDPQITPYVCTCTCVLS